MCISSPIVYSIWIGESTQVPTIMTIALSLYFIFCAWDSLQRTLINGIGTIRLQSIVTLIGLIVYIPISLSLGRYIGAYGVIASQIFITMMYSIIFTIQLRKILAKKTKGIWTA